MKIALLEPLAPEDFTAAVDRLILTRWVASGLVVGLTLACVHWFGIPLPSTPLLWEGGTIAAYNALLALFAALLRRAQKLDDTERVTWCRRLVIGQVALDWISITVFVHYTGGVTSPAIPLFLIHMLMVTALLRTPSPYIYPALATASLCALAGLEHRGILAHHGVLPLPEGLHSDLRFVPAPIAFFALAAFASVHMTRLVVARLRERDRQVSALLLASQAATSSLELQEVLEHLVESAAQALAAPAASIRLLAETGGHAELFASTGLSESYLNRSFVDLTQSELDCAVLAGEPIVVSDATRDARIQYHDPAVASVLVVPIVGRRGPLGVLRVYAAKPSTFAPEVVAFALSLASQGAAAIENALAHDALQRAEETRAQFVRTVTHELRSPIAGAVSLARVLLEGLVGELQPEQRSLLARVCVRLGLLGELVNDLLALAASQSPTLQEQPLQVDLTSALRRAVEPHRAEGTAKGVDVQLHVPQAPVVVHATDEGLARVFGNLVGNAVKYTPEGGRVEVRASVRDNGVVVTVADTGAGVPEQDLPRLFQDFFRARNARESDIPGTGLGLAIVKRLVTSFGGVISVQSTLGEGTTFTVGLPLSEPESAELLS